MRSFKTQKRESKPALGVIKASSFYSASGGKTKLNWFCYELAMQIYDAIKESLGVKLRRQNIREKSIAEFSIRFSKDVGKRAYKMHLTGVQSMPFPYELITREYPGLDENLVWKMRARISDAWKSQYDFCQTCPTQCLIDPDGRCYLFDDYGV